jgi:phage shock protein PspC (stress-responsive transcriptional regulator)
METSDIPPQGGPRDGATAGNRAGQRTLRRPAQDRLFAGVGAGVADYLGTDVTATRVGLAAAAVLAHVAIPVYVAGWALIPEEGKSRSCATGLSTAAGGMAGLGASALHARASPDRLGNLGYGVDHPQELVDRGRPCRGVKFDRVADAG